MIVKFSECNCSDNGLFIDLGNYSSVDKWIEGIINGEANYRPLDGYCVIDNKPYPLINGGQISDEAANVIKNVKHLPAAIRHIPNDTLEVIADAFEHELVIHLKSY
jgi:hypothetical protein